MMFPKKWFPIFLVIFLAGAIWQKQWLAAIPIAIGIITLIAHLWRKYSLKRICYRRKLPYRRGFPGELLPIKYEVENQKFLPLSWLKTKDPMSLAIAPDDESILAPSIVVNQGNMINLFNLRWYERINRDYLLRLRNRGVFQLGPVTLESGDLFGIYDTSETWNNTETVTVFPEIVPLSFLKLPTDDPFGDRKSPRHLFEDPIQPIGIRAYHPEDEFRRVHWSATARTGSMQVKVYQSTASQVMVVCFNVNTSPQPWLGIYPELFEQIIRVSASIVYYACQEGYSVGLMSNGYMVQSDRTFYIPPGRSREQVVNLLQALARTTHFSMGNFESFLFSQMSKIQYGATVVIITAFVTDRLLEALLRLKKYRTQITLISLEETPPENPQGIRVIHLPFETK